MIKAEMIKAEKSKFYDFIFLKYLNSIFKSNFHSINIIKYDELLLEIKNINKSKNMIFVQNH